MCQGVCEIYHLCGHPMEILTSSTCSAGYNPSTGCNKHAFSQFYLIRRTKPDICVECQVQAYRNLENKYKPLTMSLKTDIDTLKRATAVNSDTSERMARLINDPFAEGLIKYMIRDLQRDLVILAELLAEGMEEKEVWLRSVRRRYLAELNSFREKHRICGDEEEYLEYLSGQRG